MTDILGMGMAPFGSSIFGYGTPAEEDIQLTNLLFTPSGGSEDARYIDPSSQDYVFNADGTLQGASSVSQRVYLALITTIGSAAVPTVGSQFWKIKVIDDSSKAKITNYVYLALSLRIKQNLIRIIDVVPQTNPSIGLVSVKVVWFDVKNGTSFTTTV